MESGNDVDVILTECLTVLEANTGGVPISRAAHCFWWQRYRRRFVAALSGERPRVWHEDRARVLIKVQRLAALASHLAREDGAAIIERSHALRASESNDCPPSTGLTSRVTWCEPEPIPGPEGERWSNVPPFLGGSQGQPAAIVPLNCPA
jgi:hypothetical protein